METETLDRRAVEPPFLAGRRGRGGVFFLLLWVLAAAGLISFSFAVSRMSSLPGEIERFYIAYAVGFASYLGGCALALRDPRCRRPRPRVLALLFGVALLTRLPLVAGPPTLSDDVYRYVWDGKVAAAGVNPFRHAPDAPELEPLRDPIYERVNNKSIPTIYGPTLQVVFRMAHAIAPGVSGIKLLLSLFDLGVGVLLLILLRIRGRNEGGIVLYLWNPLVIVEVAWSGHADPVGVFFLFLALVLSERGAPRGVSSAGAPGTVRAPGRGENVRAIGSSIAGTLSVLTKFAPLPALPFLWKRRWLLSLATTVVLAALLYAPFVGPGIQIFRGLREYAFRWRANDSLFAVLYQGVEASPYTVWMEKLLATDPGDRLVGAVSTLSGTVDRVGVRYDLARPLVAAKLLAALIFGCVWISILRTRLTTETKVFLVFGALLLLSPTLHPWYLLWVIPFLPLAASSGWLLLSGTVVLAYAPLPIFQSTGRWIESSTLKAVEFLPVYALLIRDWMRIAANSVRTELPHATSNSFQTE